MSQVIAWWGELLKHKLYARREMAIAVNLGMGANQQQWRQAMEAWGSELDGLGLDRTPEREQAAELAGRMPTMPEVSYSGPDEDTSEWTVDATEEVS